MDQGLQAGMANNKGTLKNFFMWKPTVEASENYTNIFIKRV